MALNTFYSGNWSRFGCSVQAQVPLHSDCSWRAEPSAPGTAHDAPSILQFKNHLDCSKSFIIFWERFITPLVVWTPQISLFSALDENHKSQDAATPKNPHDHIYSATALSQPFHDFYFLSWWKKSRDRGSHDLHDSSDAAWSHKDEFVQCSSQRTHSPPISTNFTLNFFSLRTRENWLSRRRGP